MMAMAMARLSRRQPVTMQLTSTGRVTSHPSHPQPPRLVGATWVSRDMAVRVAPGTQAVNQSQGSHDQLQLPELLVTSHVAMGFTHFRMVNLNPIATWILTIQKQLDGIESHGTKLHHIPWDDHPSARAPQQ